MSDVTLRVFRGDRDSGAPVDYQSPAHSRHGRARRAAFDPGASGAGPRRALELQSREVRLLLRRSQWPPAPHVQNAHGRAAARRARHRLPHEIFPADQGSRHRRHLELQSERQNSALPAAPRRQVEDGAARRRPRARNFASASSASSARTSATSCAITPSKISSADRASSCASPASRCIRSTARPARNSSKNS